MSKATFIQIPHNLKDEVAVRRFFEKLVLQLDIAFGNRGVDAFATSSSVQETIVTATYVQNEITKALVDYIKKNGSTLITDTLNYDDALTALITNDEDLTHKKYVDDKIDSQVEVLKPEQALITALGLTVGATYNQSEVQSIADKVDEILVALKGANIVSDT